MLVNDPTAFSLLIPTFNGTPFLTRTLDYFSAVGFKGQIVLSDNSAPEPRAFVESCPRRYPGLAVKVFTYPEPTRFLAKLTHTLQSLSARCVMLHAHDDFLLPEAAEACVQLLEARPEYSAARGRATMFGLERDADRPPKLWIIPHTMHAYEQSDPVERVIGHIELYSPAFYSVHRRMNLIECLACTEARTKNVVFFQYLSSAISALQGKIHCSDQLFYVRQKHSKSWSAELYRGDYEHWPMLITSPRFSQYYLEFRDSLAELVAQRCGVDQGDFRRRLDVAATSLMRRGFCMVDTEDPREDQFRERLSNPGSLEHARVQWLLEFTLRYPETF
jgi:glycosyltransferase domain-containing protein